MTLRPVSDYLICFDAGVQPSLEDDHAPSLGNDPLLSTPLPQDDPADVAATAWEQGREDGYAAGVSDARQEAEATLEAQKRAFVNKMARDREAWAASEGGLLSGKVTATLARVEERIGASVVRALSPVLAGAIRDKAIRELTETVGLIIGRNQPLIAISGPEDLLEAMKLRLGAAAAHIVYTTGPDCDVQIIADETLIQSGVQSWIERLELSSE